MGKRNKSKKQSITNEAKRPVLPPEFIQLSFKKRNRLHYTATSGITKAWLTTTRRCNASIEHPQLYHLNVESSKSTSSPHHPHNHFLKTDSDVAFECRNPNASPSYWCTLEVDPTFRILPTSTPNYLNNSNMKLRAVVVKLSGVASSTLMVYYVDCNSRYAWIRHECTTHDPFDANKKCLKFTSVVRFEGKFYALSLQGALVVMQSVDSRLRITGMSTSRGVPSSNSRFYKEYLVEVDREILLVFLIYEKWLGSVDKVEVYRLGYVKLDWIKAEKWLGGKTLILDKWCVWANSMEIGCRENCIYFTQGSDNRWWIYDIESSCISPA